MSEPLAQSSGQQMLFAEAFPVSRTPLLADEAALRMSATSGPSSPESFAFCDRDGLWRKTCRGCSQVTLDGSLERFSETWPRAGMTRNGTAYLRRPLAPLTDGTESGLWPTPTEDGNYNRKGASASSGDGLATAVRRWPTPNVPNGGRTTNTSNYRKNGSKRQIDLAAAVKAWPTPAATDWKGQYKPETVNARAHSSSRGVRLPEEVSKREQNSGSLNPTWVEALMGYPHGWTDVSDKG